MGDANDGMLLNFSVGDGIVNATPNFKGGRWKDRLHLKKGARYHQQKIAKSITKPNPSATEQEKDVLSKDNNAEVEEEDISRPGKRRRVEDHSHERYSKGFGGHSKSGERNTGKPHQVISSLFSFNPTYKTPTEKTAEEVAPAEPSNAPLIDGISTFTTLGISPTLSAHLLQKLELKAPTAIQKAVVPELIREDSDAFIQAETGSGKTLAYLLPIVQRIMASSGQLNDGKKLSADGKLHRDSGLFAIVLVPTRELGKQIAVVLERLLRCAHWIVGGTVLGGENKKSEKARLRKGLNILVATPGRLADHLDNTMVLNVSNLRWLVLDEGDRLMELGFEAEIQGIVEKIEKRCKVRKARSVAVGGLPNRRITVLCSATMKMNVQRLGELSLKDAVHLKVDPSEADAMDGQRKGNDEDNFSAPAQLKQSYAVVPAKLRLVTLVAVLKRSFVRRGTVMKAIVFISCADSVDFHFEVLARQEKGKADAKIEPATKGCDSDAEVDSNDSDEDRKETSTKEAPPKANDPTSSTIAPASIFSTPDNKVMLHKLHGSLAQKVRTATLSAFTHSKDPAILICTDVASRGLDLPNVDFVIEYDPPFSKDDHLHRVGRTARAGKDGRALIFLLPGDEEGYVNILKESYRDGGKGLSRNNADELLKRGFGSPGVGAGRDWEERATDWQLDIERWTLEDPQHLEMARRAYQSHVRAYATHVAAEKSMFDIKSLHLGHLAKAFALRDKPGSIKIPGARGNSDGKRKPVSGGHAAKATGDEGKHSKSSHDILMTDGAEAAKKMRMKMREHMTGISEFNIG